MKKEIIKEKFIELAIKNQSVKITVQELCKCCNISRTTFYKCFKDCNDIIEYILITDAISNTYTLAEKRVLDKKLLTINWYLSFFKHQEFYAVAIRDSSQNSLFDTIIELLTENNKKLILNGSKNRNVCLSGVDIDYYAYKYAATQAMLLRKWMNDGMKVSPEKMAEFYIDNSKVDKLM